MLRKSLAIALGLLLLAGWAFAEGQTDRLSFTTDEQMDISWGGLTSFQAEEGNPVQRHIEEKFNVTLETKGVSLSDEEAKQLFMSSGEYPEAFYTWVDMVDWYHKGAFRTIPRDMIETYAPLHSAYRSEQGPLAWGVSLAPGSTDEYLNIPRGEHYQHHCDAVLTMRLDWLEKIGIDPFELDPKAPGYDRAGEKIDLGAPTAPDTYFWWAGHFDWDEMEAAMYGFRDADFNGNGKRDEIPYGTVGDHGGFQGREWLYHSGPAVPFWAYGVNDVDNYLDIDTGLTVKVDIASQSREALKILQRWFADGILDPALPAVGRNEWRQQVRAGLVGMWARGRQRRLHDNPRGCGARRTLREHAARLRPHRSDALPVGQPCHGAQPARGLRRQDRRLRREAGAYPGDLRLPESRPGGRPDLRVRLRGYALHLGGYAR